MAYLPRAAHMPGPCAALHPTRCCCCRGKPNPLVQLPQVLRAVQPGMKLVLMLRDPVERLHSGT